MADAATLAAVGSGLSNVGGGLLGLFGKNAAEEQQLELQRKALQEWLNINVPDPEQQKLYLERLKSQGQLTPELEAAMQLGDTEMKNISVDPVYKEAQLEALSGLGQVADEGGLLLEDRANLEKVMGEAQAQERGSREAIQQNMDARGISGSGLEMAAKLSNQQASAQRAHQASLDTAASARSRALDAMMRRGEMAGQQRSQEFGEQKDVASAQDIINKFNNQNSQAVQQRNIEAKNAAQLYNLQEKQRIADSNTGLANSEQAHNKGLLQQQYQNQMDRAAGVSGQYNTNAGTIAQQGKDQAAMWAGIGKGAGDAALGAGDYFNKKKKDEK